MWGVWYVKGVRGARVSAVSPTGGGSGESFDPKDDRGWTTPREDDPQTQRESGTCVWCINGWSNPVTWILFCFCSRVWCVLET